MQNVKRCLNGIWLYPILSTYCFFQKLKQSQDFILFYFETTMLVCYMECGRDKGLLDLR